MAALTGFPLICVILPNKLLYNERRMVAGQARDFSPPFDIFPHILYDL